MREKYGLSWQKNFTTSCDTIKNMILASKCTFLTAICYFFVMFKMIEPVIVYVFRFELNSHQVICLLQLFINPIIPRVSIVTVFLLASILAISFSSSYEDGLYIWLLQIVLSFPLLIKFELKLTWHSKQTFCWSIHSFISEMFLSASFKWSWD